jgi:glycosidase
MQFALQNLVDSHDTDRLASMIVNRPAERETYLQADRFDYDSSPRVSPRHDPTYSVRKPTPGERRLQRMVVLLQMTYLGAPMVYYGDEAGMWGGDDPCDRWPMFWEDLGTYPTQSADPLDRPRDADEVAVDRELLEFYRQAIALRHEHPILRRGSCSTAATDDEAQFFAFRRELDGKQVLVAFNRGEKEFLWQLPEGAEQFTVVFATEQDVGATRGDGAKSSVILPALSAAVLAEP